MVRMPVAQSASAQPTQTTMTGSLSQMNSAMTTATMAKTIQMSVKGRTSECAAGRISRAPACSGG